MTTLVPLTRGLSALIDAADAPLVLGKPWHALRSGKVFRPAHCYRDNTGRRRTVLLYRLLLNAEEGQVVDHINGDPLDNRRSNLRLVTSRQNAWNRVGNTGTSKFKGVSEVGGKWYARAPVSRFGPFNSETEAARFYDALALALHGSFARLNEHQAAGLNVEAIS